MIKDDVTSAGDAAEAVGPRVASAGDAAEAVEPRVASAGDVVEGGPPRSLKRRGGRDDGRTRREINDAHEQALVLEPQDGRTRREEKLKLGVTWTGDALEGGPPLSESEMGEESAAGPVQKEVPTKNSSRVDDGRTRRELQLNGKTGRGNSARATLLWMDLEMTGLDPEQDKILEVAAIATDMELNQLATYEATIKVDDDLIKERMIGDFWEQNSKTRDALIAENQSGRPIKEVEQELIKFLDQHFKKTIYLAGNSIHQDRKFIEREMPELNKRLHYRMLDVSAWKIYFENAKNKKFTKPENHRALDDINGSIEELKWYLTFLK